MGLVLQDPGGKNHSGNRVDHDHDDNNKYSEVLGYHDRQAR